MEKGQTRRVKTHTHTRAHHRTQTYPLGTQRLAKTVPRPGIHALARRVALLIEDRDSEPTSQDALLINLEARMSDQKLAADSLARTQFTAERVGRLIAAVEFVPNIESPQLSGVCMRRPELLQVEVLKHLNYELVIRSPRLAVVEHRGKEVIQKIFKTLAESDGALLPEDWQARHAAGAARGVTEARRVICDYVACMTDRYAAEFHDRLFGNGSTIFKPL